MPSLVRMVRASYSFRARNSAGKSWNTCSSTVFPSSMTGVWGRQASCTLGSRVTRPESGASTPARTFNRVLLPVPFTPISPTRSPAFRYSVTSFSSVLPP